MERNRSQGGGTEIRGKNDRGRRDSGNFSNEDRRFMRFGSENSEFKDKSVRQWLEMNDALDLNDALQLISEARLIFPDFAMALKYFALRLAKQHNAFGGRELMPVTPEM